MENIVLNVRDIAAGDRSALEHVVGHSLSDSQQLIIQIVNFAPKVPPVKSEPLGPNGLPEWCNVYKGLSDKEIAELEKIVLTRADLTRPSE